MAPWVPPYSIPGEVQLPQMTVVENIAAIQSEQTSPQAQAIMEIPTGKARNTIDTKVGILKKALLAWTFQLSAVTELRNGSYQSTRAYAIHVGHNPLGTKMHIPDAKAQTSPADYQP
jgi:hypothetical protein